MCIFLVQIMGELWGLNWVVAALHNIFPLICGRCQCISSPPKIIFQQVLQHKLMIFSKKGKRKKNCLEISNKKSCMKDEWLIIIFPEMQGYALLCVGFPSSDLEVETQDEDEVQKSTIHFHEILRFAWEPVWMLKQIEIH